MVKVEAIRSELEILLKDLAKVDVNQKRQDEGVSTAAGLAKVEMGDTDVDYAQALHKLSSYLAGAVDNAEEVLITHPFVAISAAFMLGVVVGRISKQQE